MKLNWSVRFKNKVWLTTFLALIVGFIFNVLKMFEVAPTITENQIMDLIGQILTVLGLFGVIIDPTTSGVSDSNRAMGYVEPWKDSEENVEEDE